MSDNFYRVSVGLEEGPGSATRVHALDLPGCTAEGDSPQEALDAFPAELSEWLHFLAAAGEPVPSQEDEIEITVDEWVRTDAEIDAGVGDACFDADFRPLLDADIDRQLRWLGDLRGLLLPSIRRMPDAELDGIRLGEWSLRQILDELARAQWWTLTRLGASPMAEVPTRTLSRLDTAIALIVQTFTHLPPERRASVVELDGETWTPRKVLRRLLSLEWSLGRAARDILAAQE